MGKRVPIWVDSARTKTAADVTSVGECDALIHRFSRNIAEILEQGGDQPGAAPTLKRALFFRRQGIAELEVRKRQLNGQ